MGGGTAAWRTTPRCRTLSAVIHRVILKKIRLTSGAIFCRRLWAVGWEFVVVRSISSGGERRAGVFLQPPDDAATDFQFTAAVPAPAPPPKVIYRTSLSSRVNFRLDSVINGRMEPGNGPIWSPDGETSPSRAAQCPLPVDSIGELGLRHCVR